MQVTHTRNDNWSRLLTRVGKHRDRVAFEVLYNHFAPLIKGFCISNSSLSAEAAEELLQEVMLNVWQKAPNYEAHRVSASTWIFTIMRNCRIESERHDSELARLSVDDIWDDTTESQPFVFLERPSGSDDISQRLQNLPVEQFHVVKKVYVERLPQQQISKDLNLPVSAIKSRLRIALKKLLTKAKR
jgi:RNA polymerase sigma factor (sigma-70 family)